jgi:hypothetical protein
VRGKRVGGSGGEGKRVGVSAAGVSAFRGKRIGGSAGRGETCRRIGGGVSAFRGKRIGESARGVSALGAWRSAFSGLSVW